MADGRKDNGGKREGAGRKPKARAQPTEDGVMPIDFLLATMRGKKYENGELVDDNEIPLAIRLDAGKAAAPYLYPRLSAIDSTIDVDGKLHISVIDYGKGKFGNDNPE